MQNVPLMNPATTYDYARRTYLKYLAVYRMLERCFRGMVHPQKRSDIAAILETVLVRLVQLRATIVKWARSCTSLTNTVSKIAAMSERF